MTGAILIDTKADWNIYMYMYIGDYVLLILITSYMYTCDSFIFTNHDYN